MSYAKIARRYARALLELGAEQNNLDTLVREIGSVAEAFDGSAELRAVVDNPEIPRAARKAVFVELAAKLGCGAMTKNTLSVLADASRLRALPEIAAALREEADRRAGVVRASVTSAQPLGDAYIQKLTQALESRFKKKVVVVKHVDPTLLAGVVTRVGDTVIDGSLRARLDELRAQLLPN